MQTRTIPAHTEIRLYKLILNPMKAPKIEISEIAAVSTEYKKLVEWYKSQLAPELWYDGRWGKSFVQGSPLEWYNPASNLDLNAYDPFDHGIRDEWVREETYLDIINSNRFKII